MLGILSLQYFGVKMWISTWILRFRRGAYAHDPQSLLFSVNLMDGISNVEMIFATQTEMIALASWFALVFVQHTHKQRGSCRKLCHILMLAMYLPWRCFFRVHVSSKQRCSFYPTQAGHRRRPRGNHGISEDEWKLIQREINSDVFVAKRRLKRA